MATWNKVRIFYSVYSFFKMKIFVNYFIIFITNFIKAEMARDLINQQTQRQETDSKTSYDAKEQARRKRFGNAPKKINPEDQPWILSNKSNEKASKQLVLYLK